MTSDIKIVDIGDTKYNKIGGTDQKIYKKPISENVSLSDLNVNTKKEETTSSSSLDGSDSDSSSSDDISESQSNDKKLVDIETLSTRSESSSSSNTSDVASTVELLSRDPLYMVLSEYFMSKRGNNIIDILEKINKNLEKLVNK